MNKVSAELVEGLKKQGNAKLEDLSLTLAIDVVSEILGLTNSDRNNRARRIQNVLGSSLMMASNSAFARAFQHVKRAFHLGVFFVMDVRPAINARKKTPARTTPYLFIWMSDIPIFRSSSNALPTAPPAC